MKGYDLAWAEEVTGIRAPEDQAAAEYVGTGQDEFPPPRARHRAPHARASRTSSRRINLVLATGRIGKPLLRLRHDHRPGEWPGGARARPQVRPAPRQPRHREPEAPGVDRRRLGRARDGDSGEGALGLRDRRGDPPGRDQGAPLDLLQPARVAPERELRPRGARQARVLRRDRLLPLRDRPPRRCRPRRVAPRGGGGGRCTTAEGRVTRIRAAIDPPDGAWRDTDVFLDLARRLGKQELFDFAAPAPLAGTRKGSLFTARRIFDELRAASKGGTADYFGITYEKIEANLGVFWPCPSLDHPGTPRLWEDRKFATPDGKAHFNAVRYRDPGEVTDADYPVILTTGRVVSQYLSGTQTRRIGKLVKQYPEPLLEIHPALARRASGSPTATS